MFLSPTSLGFVIGGLICMLFGAFYCIVPTSMKMANDTLQFHAFDKKIWLDSRHDTCKYNYTIKTQDKNQNQNLKDCTPKQPPNIKNMAIHRYLWHNVVMWTYSLWIHLDEKSSSLFRSKTFVCLKGLAFGGGIVITSPCLDENATFLDRFLLHLHVCA